MALQLIAVTLDLLGYKYLGVTGAGPFLITSYTRSVRSWSG